ncbi:MAG: PilZ domain-containing protein [Sphingomonas bacterium]|nr:PilZ domain-containing protein [Sphingomonas bacterium]
MFAAEFESAKVDNRRRSVRAPVSLDARIGKAARTLCKVVDISAHGAKLQTYSSLKRGDMIWLTLPEIGSIAADVMWADDYVGGCQFHEPIDEAALARLLDKSDTTPR